MKLCDYCSQWRRQDSVRGCEEGHETKRKKFKGDTQNYYEIHAINNDRQLHRVQCQSLCGSEVTRKIKQLEVDGRHVPQCPIAGDANDYSAKVAACMIWLIDCLCHGDMFCIQGRDENKPIALLSLYWLTENRAWFVILEPLFYRIWYGISVTFSSLRMFHLSYSVEV